MIFPINLSKNPGWTILSSRDFFERAPSVSDYSTLITGKDGYGDILILAERSASYCIIEKLPHSKNIGEIAKTEIRQLYACRLTGVLTITTREYSGILRIIR